MSFRFCVAFALALMWPIAACAADAPPIASVVVPVVGSILGANHVHWQTDVELRNDAGSEATVSLILPTAAGQPAIITTIPAGESVRFADVVGQAFGIESALSPLLIQTLGRRSVSVRATIQGVRDGVALAPQPVAIRYGSTYFPLRILRGLSFSDTRRTNVGIANMSDSEAPVTLALQLLPGRNLAITHLLVPPNTLWHTSIQSLFPLITAGDEFSILVETAVAETEVYASVIENATSAARFVQSTIGAGQNR